MKFVLSVVAGLFLAPLVYAEQIDSLACLDSFHFDGTPRAGLMCQLIAELNAKGVVPILTLDGDDDDDDDCPDDGDPTLECNPTLMPMPPGKFVAIFTIDRDGYGLSMMGQEFERAVLSSLSILEHAGIENGPFDQSGDDQILNYKEATKQLNQVLEVVAPESIRNLEDPDHRKLSFILLRERP